MIDRETSFSGIPRGMRYPKIDYSENYSATALNASSRS